MKIRDVLETAKIVGRAGYDLSKDSDAVAFLNIAIRRLAMDAKPMALLSNTSNISDKPLVWLDDCNFIKHPQAIQESDLEKNTDILLDDMLFDAMVFALLTTLNPENEYFFKQYVFFKNQYRESVFNDGLRKHR